MTRIKDKSVLGMEEGLVAVVTESLLMVCDG